MNTFLLAVAIKLQEKKLKKFTVTLFWINCHVITHYSVAVNANVSRY